MNHVTVDDDSRRAVEFRAARIIDCFVVAVITKQCRIAQVREPPQVLHRSGRIQAESERGSIWCKHQVVFLPTLQCQRRYAKGSVLINVVSVERTEGRFRNPPRQAVLPRIANLTAHGIVTGAIEQRILMRLSEQQRHQIFEHRPAPRQKWQPPVCGPKGPTQSPPMFYRRFSARDGQEARQARFACEQIVKRAVKPALSHLVPNGKNSPFLIIKKLQPHAAFQLLALADQFVKLRELLRGVPARTVGLCDKKVEPLAHVARYFLVLSPLIKRKQWYQPRDALDGNVA